MDEPAQDRPQPRLTAVAALLAASVLLSRVLGYVREGVLAYQIGAGAEADAYRAAFMLPDLLNYFLAGGALSIAFIPFYTRVRAQRGDAAAQRLLAGVLGTTTALATAVTLLLWWQAEALVALQFPRFTPEAQALTVRLTRILLPAQIGFVAGGVLRGALMAHGRFATQALAPVLYNLAIIAGGLALGGTLGAEGFAWGALAGAVLGPFGAALVDALRTPELRVRLRVTLDAQLRAYLAVAAPLMFGLTLLTVDEWYDKWFGGLLGVGTVALLGYARVLLQLPVAIVGQAIATAALPLLSRLHSEGRREELDRTLQGTLQAGLALAVLAAVGFLVFAEPVVTLLYQRGRFDAGDTADTAALLRIFAFAVPAWVTQQIAVRAFFARGDTWRPMLLGTGIALPAAALYLGLGRHFGAAGLAAAGVAGMSANALATLLWARHRHGAPDLRGLLGTGARAAAIAAGAGLIASFVPSCGVGPSAAALRLALGGAIFGALVLGGVRALGDAPMREALARLLAGLRRRP